MDSRDELFNDFGFLARTYTRMSKLPHEAIRMYLGSGTREDSINMIRYWTEYLRELADLTAALEKEVDPIRRELGRE